MPTKTPAADLEAEMRKISALVSLVAILLMATGFVDVLFSHQATVLPGASALPLSDMLSLKAMKASWGLWTMSVGIFMLALLPMLRVLLSFWFFFRDKDWLDMGVSFVVFLELLSSLHVGG